MTSQYGAKQLAFIKQTREAVKANPTAFFAQNNWRDITPKGGRFDSSLLDPSSTRSWEVDDFYVKSIAMWVPHLLVPTHTPACPHCGLSTHVHVDKAKWIGSPKILYGKERHRYLDTMLYPCKLCDKTFAGYNKDSMKLDGKVYYVFFNFYLGHRYAVDDELYRHIVEEATTLSTASIAQRLKASAYSAYYDDHQLYLRSIIAKKIRPNKKQRTLDNFVGGAQLIDATHGTLQRRKVHAQTQERRLHHNLQGAQARLSTDIVFRDLMKSKKNHNVVGDANVIPGLGPVKISRLMQHGITSAFELMQADPEAEDLFALRDLLPIWQGKAEAYYKAIQVTVDALKQEYDEVKIDLADATTALVQYLDKRLRNPYAGGVRRKRILPVQQVPSTKQSDTFAEFSNFQDKKGFNGRLISKFRIDQIVTAVFKHRKAFIESKMKSVRATIIKIDFNYKIAAKIRVWTKQGQSFTPFKCIITIQNEDGLTIFWKALRHSESLKFSEIQADLIRLRHRLNRNLMLAKQIPEKFIGPVEQSVKVTYVDNCCNVKRIVRRCFPGTMIKLDLFHWLKRWNDILFEPNKEQAGVFRAMMSKALFNIGKEEYEAAKERAKEKKKREPTVKEIRKEARSTIPRPSIIRENVEAVLAYIQAKDAQTEHILTCRRADDTSPPPKKFIKPIGTRGRIRDQFQHIDCGCLSDPPQYIINLHRHNAKRDVVFVARGTNSNERDNFDLGLKILSATHVGIHRAERLIVGFFEMRNQHKSITRLGEVDYGTYQTERLLHLNSYATMVGFKTVPYPNVSSPSEAGPRFREYMGFNYKLEINNADDNAAADTEIDEDGGDDSDLPAQALFRDTELQSILEEACADFDIEVIFPDEEYVAATNAAEQSTEMVQLMDAADVAEEHDMRNAAAIEKALSRLLPENTKLESSMNAFKRLTEERPWIPFRMPDSTCPPTDIDNKEARLFDEMEVDFKRGKKSGPSPPAHKSYHVFARRWNELVHQRFKASCTSGDENIIIPRLKSCLQLQEYYDKRQQIASLQASLPRGEDADLDKLQTTLRTNRNRVPRPLPPHTVTPPVYLAQRNGITPFGHPTALNAEIAAGVVVATAHSVPGTVLFTPYIMRQPNLPVARPAPKRPPVFRSRRFCVVCGFLRSTHVAGEGVGEKCTRSFCGKCYNKKMFHKDANGNPTGFGRHCTNATSPSCLQNVAEWYSDTVSLMRYT